MSLENSLTTQSLVVLLLLQLLIFCVGVVKDVGLIFNFFCLMPFGVGERIVNAVSPPLVMLGVLGGGIMVHLDIVGNPIFNILLATSAFHSTRRLMGWDKDVYFSASSSPSNEESHGRRGRTEGEDGNNTDGSSTKERYHGIGGDAQVFLLLACGSLAGVLVVALKRNDSNRKAPRRDVELKKIT